MNKKVAAKESESEHFSPYRLDGKLVSSGWACGKKASWAFFHTALSALLLVLSSLLGKQS